MIIINSILKCQHCVDLFYMLNSRRIEYEFPIKICTKL